MKNETSIDKEKIELILGGDIQKDESVEIPNDDESKEYSNADEKKPSFLKDNQSTHSGEKIIDDLDLRRKKFYKDRIHLLPKRKNIFPVFENNCIKFMEEDPYFEEKFIASDRRLHQSDDDEVVEETMEYYSPIHQKISKEENNQLSSNRYLFFVPGE